MNARIYLASFFVVVVLGVGITEAKPIIGTAKARGDYRGWNASQSTQSIRRSRSTHPFRSPAIQSSPTIAQSPAAVSPAPQVAQAQTAQVAQAPTESRRFSYAPATDPATRAGVVGDGSSASTNVPPQGDRRFSYAPTESAVTPTGATPVLCAPLTTAPRVHSSNLGSSRSCRGTTSLDRWALPKTDSRKFNN